MAVKDLVSGVLAESITTSTTNVLVTIAENISASEIQSFFPTPPFYITIMPKSPVVGVANRLNSEILHVTEVGNDQVGNAALTCVRGQRDTTAKAFEAGSIVTVGVYTDDAVLLGGTGTTETETPWIGVADIIWSQMIDKIYPVGSIFMSATLSTASAVSNALGGTWVAWGTGRVPVGVDTSQTEFDTVEETGGIKTTKHIAYAPPINSGNSQNAGAKYLNSAQTKMSSFLSGGGGSNFHRYTSIENVGGSIGDNSGIATEVGYYGYNSNNLQPYITCYMYKRIAITTLTALSFEPDSDRDFTPYNVASHLVKTPSNSNETIIWSLEDAPNGGVAEDWNISQDGILTTKISEPSYPIIVVATGADTGIQARFKFYGHWIE